ncbi:hypothetical protein AGOR_G00141200 [Albula goreensis]|uniref:SCA7 domain-containing protein n=1 Tax=Albula goreensis TaxID=1534307 RepID=A0A8T3DFB9_9TELE|nr:hypothetical protein AGOR_G00141200 [Albula goreensis]
MMAVCERAAAVMAALDRRIPSLDDFVGQSWSTWVNRVGVFVLEGCDVEECSRHGKSKVETISLRKEDMGLFGLCPAQDEFYLVVCRHCGLVLKPPALERHCERRHGPLGKQYSRLHPSPRPCPPHKAKSLPLYQPAKSTKEEPSSSPEEQVPQHLPPNSSPPPHSPSPHSPSPSENPPPKQDPVEHSSTLRGPRTYSKTYKRLPKKECDLDRHCGVLDLERKKLCTRLLTCNIHSIQQRRQVVGRSKNFDQLVAELKMSSRVQDRAGGQPREGPEGGSPNPTHPRSQTTPSPCKDRATNCTAPSRSRPSSESAAEEQGECWEHRDAQPHLPQPSSVDSEGEMLEEPPDIPCSTWHPKPLALCAFGSHVLGCSVFTFDRRLHHLRVALSSMLQLHLSTHLWKKIPQAPDVLSQHTSSPPRASSYYNSQHSMGSAAGGAGLHSAASSLRASAVALLGEGMECPGSGLASGGSEGKSSQPVALPAPSRPQNPVGCPSKQQYRVCETESTGPPTRPPRKRRRTPPQDPSPAPGHACHRTCSAPERGPPPLSHRTIPSPHGLINGVLSPGNKPHAPPHSPEPQLPSAALPKQPLPQSPAPAPDPSSCGRGGGPGPHWKAVSYDHKDLGKRWKPSGMATPPSKLHRLSASGMATPPSKLYRLSASGMATPPSKLHPLSASGMATPPSKLYRLSASGMATPPSKLHRLSASGMATPPSKLYRLSASGMATPPSKLHRLSASGMATPPSKLHRLSVAHTGLFSWKKGGKGGGASAGLDGKLSTQKEVNSHLTGRFQVSFRERRQRCRTTLPERKTGVDVRNTKKECIQRDLWKRRDVSHLDNYSDLFSGITGQERNNIKTHEAEAMRFDLRTRVAVRGQGSGEFWIYRWMRRIAVIAAHVIVVGFTILITVLSRPGTSLFSWHPVCMSIAGMALVGGAVGVAFMVSSKHVSERPHMVSWHSVVGAFTMAVSVLQGGAGLWLALSPRPSPHLRLYHSTCSLLVYLLVVAVVMLAMFTDWFQATVRGPLRLPLVLLPLLPALVVMSQVTRAYLPKRTSSRDFITCHY